VGTPGGGETGRKRCVNELEAPAFGSRALIQRGGWGEKKKKTGGTRGENCTTKVQEIYLGVTYVYGKNNEK